MGGRGGGGGRGGPGRDARGGAISAVAVAGWEVALDVAKAIPDPLSGTCDVTTCRTVCIGWRAATH